MFKFLKRMGGGLGGRLFYLERLAKSKQNLRHADLQSLYIYR